MPRLSIIIPVYNAEAYVGEALESVFKTDAAPGTFEVIAVDDGSTDGSREVLRKFADKPDFILIEQENRGPGGARMKGLSVATGEYLWFLDSDDYLIDHAVDKVLALVNERPDAEVLMFPLVRISEDSQVRRMDYRIEAEMTMTGKDIIRNPELPVWSAPRYVLKKALMDNPWLYFPEKLIHEDEYFGVALMCLAERVRVLPDPLYVHPGRPKSIMNSLTVRSLEDMVEVHRLEMRFMKSVLDPSDHAWFRSYCFQQLMVSYVRFPRKGYCRTGSYLWHAWKEAHPGNSLKNRLGRWFYFVFPGLYDRYLKAAQ